ncbi:MAG: BatA domain-containing protein, partial [Myxococcota bacterium]
MEFIAPLMLIGAVGLIIPVAIHLIGRRRAKVVRFAALHFLVDSRRKTAPRLRLRELLLLCVRVLICLAIPLILAKPFTSCESDGPAVARGPQAAVLVIDNSFAAAHSEDGVSLLDRAKSRAQSVLEQLGPEADVAVVLAAEGSDTPIALSRDHLRTNAIIGDVSVATRPADITTALRRAAQLLATANHELRTVFLISPLAATGFRDESPWSEGMVPVLTVIDVVDRDSDPVPDNLAITDVTVERNPSTGTRGIRVTAEVSNFGDRAAVAHGIALRIADQVVAQGTVSVEPGQRQDKEFLAVVPPGQRFTDVMVELASDPVELDNRRYVRSELREEVNVLLINGDPHTARHQDELFYLEAALRPGDRAYSATTLTTATVDELPEIPIAEFDVMVLANVRAMDEERVARVAQWVTGGGGLLVSMGDNVDTEAYNRTMQPLLPQTLKDPIEVAYGSRGVERSERALRLTKWEAEHPIFAVFSQDAPGLREARFHTVTLLGTTTRVDDRRVLARYTNAAAALVEARSGRGRMILYTSTVDRDWNDLVIHPGYLPLMQQLVRYLARKQDQRARELVLVGRSALLGVSGDDARVEIRAPGGTRTVIEGERLTGRKYARFAQTAEPGFYRVWAAEDGGDLQPRAPA